ncbi:hypothetical protein FB472_1695 [Rhodoglobus vestalii]|uniref:Uncharacterized protein n=1 Tax=Rhodoglobus vestalii TaxID=193384 RepID=A0A8H2K6Z2_9MICO|nr:hypothetical protein [Rhodoglobus vestalii]TQO20084.1 hypothetical protein FB472_1695 [Rhodoglobus vestalii]
MRRELILWSVMLGLIVVAFVTVVVVLNSTLYSSSGFVRSYLGALARNDMPAALEIADIRLPGANGAVSDDGSSAGPIDTTGAGSLLLSGSRELLQPSALSSVDDITVLRQQSNPDGTESVTVSFDLDGRPAQSTFTVTRSGSTFGVFADWDFVTPPLTIVRLTVSNAREFTANGTELVAPAQDVPAPYVVLTPSNIDVTHTSTFLKAEPILVSALEPGTTVRARLTVVANENMVAQVQREVNAYLDDCATQVVLFPTGCPFGQPIENRIVASPDWSIVEYPPVSLTPGSEPASWVMPPTDAAARLLVDVRSISDGSIFTFDENIGFRTSYVVTFLADDQLSITAQ